MAEPGGVPELDPIVHGQLRLAVLSLLAGVEEADFKWLREKTGATDGNLGANLAKLERAKYIGVMKKFVAKKPNSLYRLTPSGRKALAAYIGALKKLLDDAL
jgi:DNA-binding MarR family transcriptional regulator